QLKKPGMMDQRQMIVAVSMARHIQETERLLVNADIDDFIAQQLLDDLAVFLDHFQGDAWIAALHVCQIPSQELHYCRLWSANNDSPFAAPSQGSGIVAQAMHQAVDLVDMPQQLLAGDRELYAMRLTLEQRNAKLRLQFRQTTRGRRHCQS